MHADFVRPRLSVSTGASKILPDDLRLRAALANRIARDALVRLIGICLRTGMLIWWTCITSLRKRWRSRPQPDDDRCSGEMRDGTKVAPIPSFRTNSTSTPSSPCTTFGALTGATGAQVKIVNQSASTKSSPNSGSCYHVGPRQGGATNPTDRTLPRGPRVGTSLAVERSCVFLVPI